MNLFRVRAVKAARMLVTSGIVLLITSGILAASASAAHSGHQWAEELGGKLSNGSTRGLDVEQSSKTMTITGTVQSQKLKLTSTVFDCALNSICQIKQVIEGEAGHARVYGKFRLLGVTVDEPTGCSTPGEITTNNLVGELVTGSGGIFAYLKLAPESGTTIASISLTGCAVAETYPVKGSICAEMYGVGTMLIWQKLEFSEGINTVGCGSKSFTIGGNSAALTGKVLASLVGGQVWGAVTY